MTIYSLYIKTHKKTGLKYLGQTSQNPFTYNGSGVDWKLHLKIHGDEVYTEILLETTSIEERNKWGRYYSRLWNITKEQDNFGNKIWANRISETGGGGATMTSERAISAHQKNPHARLKRIQTLSDPNINAKFRKSLSDGKNNPITKELMRKNNSGSKNPTYDHTIHSFIHKSGITENCTQYELRNRFNLNQGGLGKVVQRLRKNHKGWSLN